MYCLFCPSVGMKRTCEKVSFSMLSLRSRTLLGLAIFILAGENHAVTAGQHMRVISHMVIFLVLVVGPAEGEEAVKW